MPQTGGAIKVSKPKKPAPPKQPSQRAIEAKKGGAVAPTPAPAFKDAGGKPGGPSQRKLEAKKGGNVRAAVKDRGPKPSGDDKKTFLLRENTVSPKTGKRLSASGNISTRQGKKADRAIRREGTAKAGGARQVMGQQVQRKTDGGTSRGGSSFGSPNTAPVRADLKDRIGPTPITAENPPAYFDRGGGARTAGAGGGTGGATNPLNAGSDNLKGKDLEGILHGAKRRGRVRLARGTE